MPAVNPSSTLATRAPLPACHRPQDTTGDGRSLADRRPDQSGLTVRKQSEQ